MDDVKRSKGGRPRLPAADLRRVSVGVRFTIAERDALAGRAAAMGLSLAELVRHAALSRKLPSPPVAAINRDEYASLARLGNNLNQLAKAYHETGAVSVDADLLLSLLEEVKRLRLALLGIRSEE